MGERRRKMNIPTGLIDRRVCSSIYIHIHTHAYIHVHLKASKFRKTEAGQKSGTTLQLLLEYGEIASQGERRRMHKGFHRV